LKEKVFEIVRISVSFLSELGEMSAEPERRRTLKSIFPGNDTESPFKQQILPVA
jgi:hypothetical protein